MSIVRITVRPRLIAAMLLAVSPPARAQLPSLRADSISFARAQVITLHSGMNVLRLGPGIPAGWATVAYRENFNAHGHHVITFGATIPGDGIAVNRAWEVISFDRDTSILDDLGTTEGADCILSDIRVLRTSPSDPLTVIRAVRDLDGSYADSAAVRFEIYRLTRNANEEVGLPAYYFKLVRTLQAARKYCDVNEAFARELGLGRKGVAAAG